MEKLYRFLKILIVVLFMAVLVAGIVVVSQMTAPKQSVPVETKGSQSALAPDFTLHDIDGNSFKLSDLRGKPVILNFWASWCGPCQAEMPDFEEAYKTYGEEISFLMVNLTDGSSETVETASAFIDQQGYTFPVYYDIAMEGAAAYSVYSIPVTYFIDAEGSVRAANEGMINAETLERNIAALLAQ